MLRLAGPDTFALKMSGANVTHPKHPVSDAMLDRLRLEASHYSNFVDVILDDPDSRYGGDDGRTTL